MASEFVRRVRHVDNINTFSKWGLEEGDLVLTNDNNMYALIGQEWKQLDNMEKVWATSEAGKYLMVGDDGIVKPMVIDEVKHSLSTDSLAKNPKINGVVFNGTSDITVNPSLQEIHTPTDLFTLTNGFYLNGGDDATNKPAAASDYFSLEVFQTFYNGFMRLIDNNGLSFWITKNDKHWGSWHQDADDATVVHNYGNETSSGDKTFNGQTTLLNGNFGLRVTNTGIVKTTDAGNTWVAL